MADASRADAPLLDAALATDIATVLRDGRPLIDLRSPTEFARGAFPNATNLPLLDDAERASVGICYKAHGQAAAIALGERLVSGETRERRIDAWSQLAARHPDALLYCWRGGLRSETVQRWLAERGRRLPRIAGGYRAMRRVCLETLEVIATRDVVVLGGRTGSGKTRELAAIDGAIDLEALANHRGSAFGSQPTPQPTPIAFENALAVALLRIPPTRTIVLEDESRTIGQLGLPEPVHRKLQSAPLFVLEIARPARAEHIYDEYVAAPLAHGLDGAALHVRLAAALARIARRLGGVRAAQIAAALADAFASGARDAHLRWIERLLEWYYDPMYDHQLERKAERIVARGDAAFVVGAIARHVAERARIA